MNKVCFSLRSLYILNKRFLKNPLMLIMLILIPVSSFAIKVYTRESLKGVKALVFIQEDADTISLDIAEKLFSLQGIVTYQKAESKQKIEEKISSGEYTIAFIIPKNFYKSLQEYEKGKVKEKITVIVKEKNIITLLAKEDFYAKIFEFTSRVVSLSYLERKDAPLDEEDTLAFTVIYKQNQSKDSIFEIQMLDGKSENLELLPLRGILSVIILLTSLSAAMFFLQDKGKGQFETFYSSYCKRILFTYVFLATLDSTSISLLALRLCKATVFLPYDLVISFLFALVCTAYSTVLTLLLGKIQRFAALISLIILCSLIFCPILIDVAALSGIKIFRVIGHLLPPYYYLKSYWQQENVLESILALSFMLVCIKIIPYRRTTR